MLRQKKIFTCNYLEFRPAVQEMLEEALGKNSFNLDQWFKIRWSCTDPEYFVRGGGQQCYQFFGD